MTMSGHMARGAAWMMGLRWCIRGLDVATTIILARVLAPDDFGIFALGTLVVGFLEILTLAGIDLALIKNRDATDAHFNAAWTIQVGQGVAAAGLLLLAAPWLGVFFQEPRVVPVIQLLAIRPLIQSLTNTGAVCFLKDLDYRTEFWFNFYKKVPAVMATLSLAWLLGNYMAMVFGSIAGALIAVVISYRMHPFRPRFALAKVPEVFSFSGWMLVYYAAEDLVEKVDRLVVGRVASSGALGQYQLAWLIASLPAESLIVPLWRALMPAYATLTHDRQQLVKTYLDVLGLTALVAFATGFGILAVAEDLVIVLLGEDWRPAVYFVQSLALVPAFAGVVDSAMMIVSVTGHAKLCALHSTIRLAVLVSVLPTVGILLGYEQVAFAYLACVALLLPLAFIILVRIVPVTARAIMACLWRPIIAGAAMLVATKALHADSITTPAATLVLDILVGAAAYVIANALLWLAVGRPQGPETLLKDYVLKSRVGAWLRRGG